MIAFEVTLNGKILCIAGGEDMCVLNVGVSCGLRLKKENPEHQIDENYHIHAGGLTAKVNRDADEFLNWVSVLPLQKGDEIKVRIIETDLADEPTVKKNARERLDNL